MEFREYTSLPDDAVSIRTEVFMDEQGFRDEFDDTDQEALHFVLYTDDGDAAGVCRTFTDQATGEGIIGRLAVRKQYRGRGFGKLIITEAEERLAGRGVRSVRLHAQTYARGFYESLGYEAFGEEEYEEHVPHIWMRKNLR